MKIDWCRSRKFHIDLSDDERVTLSARSGIRSLILGLLYVTIWRTRYIELEEVRGGIPGSNQPSAG